MKNIIRIIVWTSLLLALTFISTEANVVSAKEFKDVSKKHSNYTAIQEMQKAGFINGYPDGKFRPNEPISRKHVAVLLDKALNFKQPATAKTVFKDVPKNHAYYGPIMKLYNEGIVSGGTNGKFNPDASLTRIQMAKMLDLAFKFNMTGYGEFNDLLVTHWGYVHADALYSNGVTKGDQGSFNPNQKVTRAHYAEFLNRAMNVKSTKPETDKINKDIALDKLNRLGSTIERIMIVGYQKNQAFSQIRPTLLQFATKEHVDELLADTYKSGFLDYFQYMYTPLKIEVLVRFRYSQPDLNTLKIQTAQFTNQLYEGGFVKAEFKKESGKWKMARYSLESIGVKNFELSADEAEFIIKETYQRYIDRNAVVKFISKTQVTGEDDDSYERYKYYEYKFIVESSNGRESVVFDSDSGYYD